MLKSDVDELRTALAEVDTAIVDRLLSTRNWRDRIVGSWLCELKGRAQFEDRWLAFTRLIEPDSDWVAKA